MSLGSMTAELTGAVSQLPPDYARKTVLRAWADVQRKNLWSFLLFESNWTAPAIVTTGTVTVTQGQNTVVFDSAASAAIIAIGLIPSSVTHRQFRVGIGTIYNIWAIDVTTPTAVVLTLDRGYQEPSGSDVTYMIYQVYYPSPVEKWKAWLGVRDIINFNDLVTTKTRHWVDMQDPQRSIYYIPTHVVPYTVDLNPASSTYKYQLFELWGQPTFVLTYQLWGLRTSWDLTEDADELPPQIGEDCVLAMAKYYAYEWAEANWDRAWGTKPNFPFLMREMVNNNKRGAQGLFNRLYSEYRMQDRELVDNFRSKLRRGSSWPTTDGYYSSISGTANPGAAW